LAQQDEALRELQNPLLDPALEKISLQGVRVIVLDAYGQDRIGREPLTRALRAGIEQYTGPLVPHRQFLAAQAKLIKADDPYAPEVLAPVCRVVEGQYVVVTQITRRGWLYTARARILNCETGEYQMDFRSDYYKPREEAADRGQRIAKTSVAKMRLLISQGLEPFKEKRQQAEVTETVTATVAETEGTETATVAETEEIEEVVPP
jgi:hypothetical protein